MFQGDTILKIDIHLFLLISLGRCLIEANFEFLQQATSQSHKNVSPSAAHRRASGHLPTDVDVIMVSRYQTRYGVSGGLTGIM